MAPLSSVEASAGVVVKIQKRFNGTSTPQNSEKFLNLAYQAASSTECSLLVDNALDCLSNQLKEKINASTSILSDSYNVQPTVQQDEDMLSAARLKKKEIQPKNSKRQRSWLDKTRKFKKKVPNESNVCC